MGAAILLASLLGVAAILLVLFWLLRSENEQANTALQIVLLGFLLGIVVMIGKVAVVNNVQCDWVVNSTIVSGNTTSYDYDYMCSTTSDETGSLLYQISLWVMRLTIGFVILKFAFDFFNYFAGLKKKKAEGRDEN